jgi:hypothetical protein
MAKGIKTASWLKSLSPLPELWTKHKICVGLWHGFVCATGLSSVHMEQNIRFVPERGA